MRAGTSLFISGTPILRQPTTVLRMKLGTTTGTQYAQFHFRVVYLPYSDRTTSIRIIIQHPGSNTAPPAGPTPNTPQPNPRQARGSHDHITYEQSYIQKAKRVINSHSQFLVLSIKHSAFFSRVL